MSIRTTIDVNCDLGEGIGNEADLMPFISSCNLACGGHAGDEATIDKVVKLAKCNAVGVGAHPSFPDRANFGRVELKIPFYQLESSLKEQIDRVKKACQTHKIEMHHIKAHGALYNLCASHAVYAEFFIDFIARFYPDTPVYVPFNSILSQRAQGKIKLLFEAFADRNYEADGSLVSRAKPHALIKDEKKLFKHVLNMVKRNEIHTVSGTVLSTKIDTICVHGDTPKAVTLACYLKQQLEKNNLKIQTVICK
ncbi:UPF0271 protein [Leeuwenhoekiella aestuarii]|uniref:UPF0271 protein n=1 Tax=Leeuwenhoekiella aestuarii TaxID=2249426 RepID=A0A4Q0NVV4_9FLAO|nr:5-oxoprolinase subunit PxpA [Leeuwenhoekiella aestuarii]RXG15309.1 UPF0271 protein [Leeuwenhoekiella aestuarii]RXG17584.1 UPF0271 protein [Leeuwenhoekiella aestuarii]